LTKSSVYTGFRFFKGLVSTGFSVHMYLQNIDCLQQIEDSVNMDIFKGGC